MSVEALASKLDAFEEQVLALKPHPGMQWV